MVEATAANLYLPSRINKIEITNIVERHCRVDWANSDRILDKIAQDIDDMFYLYECSGKCKFSLDVIDKVIESVKTTALRRFRS